MISGAGGGDDLEMNRDHLISNILCLAFFTISGSMYNDIQYSNHSLIYTRSPIRGLQTESNLSRSHGKVSSEIKTSILKASIVIKTTTQYSFFTLDETALALAKDIIPSFPYYVPENIH